MITQFLHKVFVHAGTMKQYKHLFFDLDHTLWDFDSNAQVALAELYREFNLGEKLDAAFEEFYPKYLHHNHILWDRYNNGLITAEELKWKRMWRTMLEFKVADEPLARQLSDRFLQLLPVQKKLFPHTLEILDYLRNKKYELHLITNGFENTQWTKLRHSGLDKYFTHVITSEGSNSLKPKKEIFDFAITRAGTVCKDCIMIGDNLDADIQGAINAGMDSIFVNHIEAQPHIQATYTITHLKQLEDIF